MKMVLKNLKANEGWLRCHMSNFFMGRVASAILVDNFIGKGKKILTFCFLGFG